MLATKSPLLLAATALLVGLLWLGWDNLQLRQQIEDSQDYQRQIADLNESNARQRVELEQHIQGLNRQLRSSAYQLSQLSNILQETRLAVDPDYEAMLQQARLEVAQEHRSDRARTAFSQFSDPDNALALAQENIPRMYDSYINALGIPGTERQQVVAAMLDFGVRRYQMLDELLAGTLPPNQARALFGADALASSMAMTLNTRQQEDLRLFDQFLKEDTLREVYQQALNRTGSAIDEGMQNQVLETLLNELVSAENNWGALVAEDGSMRSAYDDKVAAFARARDRLAANLNAEQLAQLDRFIEVQNDGVDVILEATSDSSGRISITQARVGVEDLPQ